MYTCDFPSLYLSVLYEQVTHKGKVLCMHVILSWFWSFLTCNIKICTVCAVVTFVFKVWDYDYLLFLSSGTSGTWSIIFSPMVRLPLVGQGFLILEGLDHTQTPHLVGLFWMNDQPVAEMSALQHTNLTRDKPPCHRQDSNPQSQPVSGPQTHSIDHTATRIGLDWIRLETENCMESLWS